MKPRFSTVVLDVDSTLCGVEGIDWLAARRGGDIAERIAAMTERAMNGELSLDEVYGERLSLIRPTRLDVGELSNEYQARLAVGAAETVSALNGAGVRVVLVSGGIYQAIDPIARKLGVELHAVHLYWNGDGSYKDYERASPLTTQAGKLELLQSLQVSRPALAVGDGSTDLQMKSAVDSFVAYTGFVRRSAVVQAADSEVSSFDELSAVVFR